MEHFAVIGLGRFGSRLASLLADAGAEVIGVDHRKELVDRMRDEVTLAVCLDSTDEQALRAQGIDKVDVAVVGIGSAFENAALTTVLLKQMGVPRVVARATTTMRGQILSRIGADDVVNPESESAERWRERLLIPQVIERSALAEGFSLAQVTARKEFAGKTLAELEVGRRYKVLVVAIRRTAQEKRDGEVKERQYVITAPGPDSMIKPDDILVVIGSDEAINDFSQ